MVATDTVAGLRESLSTDTVLRVTVDRLEPDTVQAVEAVEGVSAVETETAGQPTLIVHSDGSKTAILTAIEETGVEINDFSTEEASLEEVFRAYTTTETTA